MTKPYQVPSPVDKHSRGKQAFLHSSFCDVCGEKRGVTQSYYTDPLTGRRRSGRLCGDCYSVVTETEHEAEQDGDEADSDAA